MGIETSCFPHNVGIPWFSARAALIGLVLNQNLAPYAPTFHHSLVSGGFCSVPPPGQPSASRCPCAPPLPKGFASPVPPTWRWTAPHQWRRLLNSTRKSATQQPHQNHQKTKIPPSLFAQFEGKSVSSLPRCTGGPEADNNQASMMVLRRSIAQYLAYIGLLLLWLPGSRGFSVGFSPGNGGLLSRSGIPETGAAACAAAASAEGRGCADGIRAKISVGAGASGILGRLGGIQARGLREAAGRGTGQGAVALSMQTQARGGMASLPGGGGPAWMMTELLTAGDVTSEDGRCLSPSLPLPPFPPLPLSSLSLSLSLSLPPSLPLFSPSNSNALSGSQKGT